VSGKPVRIGVVGCGLVAQRSHLPAYVESAEVELAGVCAGRLETARAAAARFGEPRVYEGWQEMIDDPEIDAIDVCAPNYLHAPVAIAAANAGKHVLVEKPMALSLQEADAMLAAARRSGVLLMVAHNLRYVPIYYAVKQAIDAGAIGRPLAARGVFMHAGPDEFWGATSDWFWQAEAAGGGSLLDMGIHMIDLMRWYIGLPVLEVAAMTARLVKPTPFDDNAVVLLRFSGDVLATIQSSWSARPVPDRQVTIHGEDGYIAMGRTAGEPLFVHVKQGDGERKEALSIPSSTPLGNPFLHFARCIRGEQEPLTSGEEGRATLSVTLAAQQSSEERRYVSPS
jgi:UDP-N-acetylglucosamine 3-dehydrogenase